MADQAAAPAMGYVYYTTYNLAGFLLRSSAVCDDPKRTIEAWGALLGSTPEFRAFAKGYPQTTNKWLKEGGEKFNESVMKDGVRATCEYAHRGGRENRENQE